MNTKKLFDKFNAKAEEWLTDLKNLDDQQLQIKPNERSWSLTEVYDHVMRVTRTYQIPNLKKSISESAIRRKRKNVYGIAIFDLRFRKNVKMKMEEFPKPIVKDFTPTIRTKKELVTDFQKLISEVNDLHPVLYKSKKEHKYYHPMFGDINTKEWFALIELHIWQHDKQRESIKKHLKEM